MNCIEAYPDSTAVKHILYEPNSRRLFLLLARDRLYCYFDVPEKIVRGLISAPSVGRYFSANIVMFRCEGLDTDDPEYLSLKGASVGNTSTVVNHDGGHLNAIEDRRTFAEQARVGVWRDSTSRHRSNQSGLPFFLEPLKDEDRYPNVVKQIQSMFRSVVKDYACPVDVASSSAIRSHEVLLHYIPEGARDYLKSILNGINVIIDVRDPRRSKAGDCRVDRERRIARVTVNENLNRFKMLCVVLHELAHVLDFTRGAPHDVVWKCLYGCLLADVYEYFPEKYRKEVEWMMVQAPAATRESNFWCNGILSGCCCEVPRLFLEDSIDAEAENCSDYSKLVQRYACNADLQFVALFLDDDAEGVIAKLSGCLARAAIVGKIEDDCACVSAALSRVDEFCVDFDESVAMKVADVVKRQADMLTRCWVKYNPLKRSHVSCFELGYRGGNPWIDELIALVTQK